MKGPPPAPGLVIRYSFLWSHEAEVGATEGSKDRPCAIVVAAAKAGGVVRTLVVPITHAEPEDLEASMELPASAATSLGLDGERHWIRLDELNVFGWLGHDVRPVPGTETYAYGVLPRALFESVRTKIDELAKSRRTRTQKRD